MQRSFCTSLAGLPRPKKLSLPDCGDPRHAALDRRTLLRMSGLAAAGWLTPVAQALARQAEQGPRSQPAQSVILLWMGGGPSQLETFDPHPGKAISGGTQAIDTAVPGIQLAAGFPQLAEQMESIALVRSLVSKEGDHERGTYFVKSGYVRNPSAVHPALGAIVCHELPVAGPDGKPVDVPRHVSIMPGARPGWGGFLGDEYDAFKTSDPLQRVPDIVPRVPDARIRQRLEDLSVVERTFARGRRMQAEATLHDHTVQSAWRMMNSEQTKAFHLDDEPQAVRDRYGDTPFGRGCLSARRLIEVGVRCVEVTLNGWDTHTDNHAGCAEQAKILDPAFSALLADLRERHLLERTLVVCAGEFGRTPQVNKLEGRDHWPHGFSLALAGGGIRGGQALGQTDPEGGKNVVDPQKIPDIHATILTALGIDPHRENITPAQRPIKLAEGEPIRQLLSSHWRS